MLGRQHSDLLQREAVSNRIRDRAVHGVRVTARPTDHPVARLARDERPGLAARFARPEGRPGHASPPSVCGASCAALWAATDPDALRDALRALRGVAAL